MKSKMLNVNSKLKGSEEQVSPIKDYLNIHVPIMENILDYYQKANGKKKKKGSEITSCPI